MHAQYQNTKQPNEHMHAQYQNTKQPNQPVANTCMHSIRTPNSQTSRWKQSRLARTPPRESTRRHMWAPSDP